MNIDLVQLNFSTGYITGNNVSVSGSVIEELNVGGDLNLDISGGTTFVSGANNISVTGDVNVTGGGIISGDVTGNVYITDSGIGYINSSSSVSVTGDNNTISGSTVYATGSQIIITGGESNVTGNSISV